MIPSSNFPSLIKNKIYNIFFDNNTSQHNCCFACGKTICEKNNIHDLGEYHMCSEECNKKYYIDILCSSK